MKYWILLSILTLAQVECADITKDELLGRFNPAQHEDFVKISSEYTSKSNIYLRKEAYTAFQEMEEAAQKDGINLTIISATRNFNYQKSIWERKWDKPKYMGWERIEVAKD
ncbi:MAG: D-alanyl-D-alanine carboxypeptidase family protein, partial [Flavobacteriales bacterium]|nr:D-alanyl-D-alanine carboxypeptidase family protein [Flavobacteriales bacterium]